MSYRIKYSRYFKIHSYKKYSELAIEKLQKLYFSFSYSEPASLSTIISISSLAEPRNRSCDSVSPCVKDTYSS